MGRRAAREEATDRRRTGLRGMPDGMPFPVPPARSRLALFRNTEPPRSRWERAWSGRTVGAALALLGLVPTAAVLALLFGGGATDLRPLPAVAMLATGGVLATVGMFSRRPRLRARLMVSAAACLGGSCVVMEILGALFYN
ncbi:MAG TPA: hypothetical protein VGJ07_16055 [Rugosimonospora sp.]